MSKRTRKHTPWKWQHRDSRKNSAASASTTRATAIENKFEHKEEDKKEHYLRREFSYTNYQQAYALPDDVKKDDISAKVEDGVLTIILPKTKKEEVKVSRHIDIA